MNIAPYYKTVVTGTATVAMAVTGVVTLIEAHPGNPVSTALSGVALGALAIVGTVANFLVRNESAIETVAGDVQTVASDGKSTVEEIWHEIEAIKDHQARTQAPVVEPYQAVAPAAQSVATVVQDATAAVKAVVPIVEDVASALARNRIA